jgi:AbiV family abortive infection protein
MATGRYSNSLDDIEVGLRACLRNAQDLAKASEKLLAADLHAPALSTAVLALEELSKMLAIDGLLFSVGDDTKIEVFGKATRSHAVKLSILEFFPMFIANVARVDPRYKTEKGFAGALAISLEQLRDDGNMLLMALGGNGFQRLDQWKQKGFYVGHSASGFEAPGDAVPLELARKVYDLAWRATSTIDFVMKNGNLERYIESARSIRAKLTEAQHEQLKALASTMVNEMFSEADGSESATH